jgi:hypothetical protein
MITASERAKTAHALDRSATVTGCSSLQHVTNSSQSVVSPPLDVPLLPGSRPRRLAAISRQSPTLLTDVSRL